MQTRGLQSCPHLLQHEPERGQHARGPEGCPADTTTAAAAGACCPCSIQSKGGCCKGHAGACTQSAWGCSCCAFCCRKEKLLLQGLHAPERTDVRHPAAPTAADIARADGQAPARSQVGSFACEVGVQWVVQEQDGRKEESAARTPAHAPLPENHLPALAGVCRCLLHSSGAGRVAVRGSLGLHARLRRQGRPGARQRPRQNPPALRWHAVLHDLHEQSGRTLTTSMGLTTRADTTLEKDAASTRLFRLIGALLLPLLLETCASSSPSIS